MNDDLAVSLAAGGRLDTLLRAADFATSPAVDPGGDVGRALCLAVDPDLLVTVNAMTAGYVVADAPDGLGTAAHPAPAGPRRWPGSTGSARWPNGCAWWPPYAQADLGALQRVGDRRLGTAATTTTADIVDQILGIGSMRGTTVLGDGPLTPSAVELLDGQGATVAIAAADTGAQDAGTGEPATADVTARRLTPRWCWRRSTRPWVPPWPRWAPTRPAHLPRPRAGGPAEPRLHRSAATGRGRFHAVAGPGPGTEPRTQILLPPLKWSPQPDDAQALLTALATTIRSGLAAARPLGTLANDAAALGPADGSGPDLPAETRGGFDDAVVTTIAGQSERLWGLTSALTTDPRTGLTGLQYTAPLRGRTCCGR